MASSCFFRPSPQLSPRTADDQGWEFVWCSTRWTTGFQVIAVGDLATALAVLNAHERVIALVGKSVSKQDAETLRSAMAGRRAALLHVQETDDRAWVERRVKLAVSELQRRS